MRPLIVVIGATGSGKSRLAIELALHLAGTAPKVINADAMQVYRGMDVLTNKVPLPDRAGVDHLLMDVKQPSEQYVVGQWVSDAIRLVTLFYFLEIDYLL
jgi:tRNA dimethylallyltransferase